MFHILLLKSASDNILVLRQVSDNYLIEQENWYEVEKTLRHKNISQKKLYLVKWKSYLNSENTWELIANLDKCTCIIEDYL